MKAPRNLSLGENIGGQLSAGAIYALILSLDGLSPRERLLGVLVIWAVQTGMGIWAHFSKPTGED